MEQALVATQIIFNLIGGLGLFFLGIGVLWYVSLLHEKQKKSNYDKL